MSLYGALFGGVSGLAGQSAKMGIVSDNIANVNTVGYKESEAMFETLVVNNNSAGSYSTGGVRNETRMNVDTQGLILSTSTATDIAISGHGMFVVNTETSSSDTMLYTRSGSFRTDEQGFFRNSAGYYLQGWPLDRDGLLPGEPGNLNTVSFGNLESLETVNIEDSSGIALATESVQINANLDAAEIVFPGQEGTVTMDVNNTLNYQISADDIIVPDEYGLATANSIVRGDTFEVLTGNGLQYEYEYGGFTIGRDITTSSSSVNFGDGLNSNDRLYTTTGADMTGDGGTGITINFGFNHNLITGDSITITGDGVGYGLLATLDNTYTVTYVSATSVLINTTAAHGVLGGPGGPAGATLNYSPYNSTGIAFDANSVNEAFFGTTGTTRFPSAALSFTISTSTDTHTFTYNSTSPNTFAGQFNSLTSLANAIDEVVGLTARVASGRLVVGAEDANEQLTFANGDDTTTSSTQASIDWISEFDLLDVPAGGSRWHSMDSLYAEVEADDGISAEISDPFSISSMDIWVDDPLDTIQFRDLQSSTLVTADGTATYQFTGAAAAAASPISVTAEIGVDPTTLGINAGDYVIIQNDSTAGLGLPATFPNTPGLVQVQVTAVNATDFVFDIPGTYNTAGYAGAGPINVSAGTTMSVYQEGNQGSVVAELGLVSSLNGAAYTPQDTGTLGPKYDSSGVVGENMASGDITPQFSRNMRLYDALGTGHDFTLSFIKIDDNDWAVEVYAVDEDEVSTTLTDGQIAVGTLSFNGDGSLRSIDNTLTNEIEINWTNGAAQSNVTIDWGTAGQPFGTDGATIIGDTDGLSQFDGDYNVNYVQQDGAPIGELISVAINEEGFVTASYSNGETRDLYKLPIADFTNVNGLKALSGNVFEETRDSGDVNLRSAGTSGAGDVISAALEQSNVELSEQLTDMIVAQRAYQANTRVISTTDELLEQLNNI